MSIKDKQQKEQVSKFIDFFTKGKRLYSINEETLKEVEPIIKDIIMSELSEIDDFDANKVQIKVVKLEGLFSPDAEFEHVRKVNKKGQIVDKPITININLSPLSSRLSYSSTNEVDSFCRKIVKNIFHEIEHLKQERLLLSGVSSNKAMTYTRDFLILDEVNKIYQNNYTAFNIESDARMYGEKRYSQVTGDFSLSNMFSVAKDNALNKTNKYSYNGEELYGDDMSVLIIDELICVNKNDNLFKLYPLLLKEYNPDCTKKSALELYNNLINEINLLPNEDKKVEDTKEMYYELIYRRLDNKEEVEELRSNISKDDFNNLINSMDSYFVSQKEKKLDTLKSIYFIDKEDYGKSLSIIKDMIDIRSYYEEKESKLRSITNLKRRGLS